MSSTRIRLRRKPKQKNMTQRVQRRIRSTHQASGGAQGVADSVRTSLTYSDVIAITPGGVIGQYTFRGNSCFDPDYTSSGHQPQYYDQLSELYTRYRVYGSRISVSAINEQVGSALQVTVIPSSDITTFTSSTYPLEHPYAKGLRLLGVGGLMSAKTRHTMTTARILGLRPREILDQDYSASTGATPASVWYWQIVAQDLSSENVQTSMQVVISYDVEFYDRNLTTPSTTIRDPESVPREQRLQMAYGQALQPYRDHDISSRQSVLYRGADEPQGGNWQPSDKTRVHLGTDQPHDTVRIRLRK